MLPPPPLPVAAAVLLLLLLAPLPSVAAPLPTIAIATTPNSTLLICALLIGTTPNVDHHVLNCTVLPKGSVHAYDTPTTYYTAVAAGDNFLCGLSSPPASNTSSMLWWEFRTFPPKFKRLYRGPPLSDLAASDTHVCGLTATTRRPQCWRWPALRNNSFFTGLRFDDLAVGNGFVCGLLASGEIRCAGNDAGIIRNAPQGQYVVVAAGASHACALTRGGQQLRCWGSGAGIPPETGNGRQESYHALALGWNRTCAIRSDRTVACWGEAGFTVPVLFVKAEFQALTARGSVFCGIKRDDFSLVCWGSDLIGPNSTVLKRVLPGPCTKSCPCSSKLSGSLALCGSGSSICDFCDIQVPPQPSGPAPSSGRTRRVIYIIIGSVGSGALLLTVVWLAVSRIQAATEPAEETRVAEPVAKSRSIPAEEFPLELLLAVTGNFAEENRIGSGGFGSVYRATLDDGREVAIKRADPASRNGKAESKEQSFLSELGLLSRVNHRNLVRLVGFCAERPELALVYEYMANGSLHDHLHVMPESPLRSWGARMRVALDAARGLEYLHRYAVPPLVHRDIKPSNILLDGNWTAKIADFGLCLAGDGGAALPTAGTVGYMDPEYYSTERLTEKSDVYSFGVVLLEVLTGRKAIHRRSSCGGELCNVVEFAVPRILDDEVEAVLDPALPMPGPMEIEAVQQVGYLAAECVGYMGEGRPAMTDVVEELQRAVAAFVDVVPPRLVRSLTAQSV